MIDIDMVPKVFSRSELDRRTLIRLSGATGLALVAGCLGDDDDDDDGIDDGNGGNGNGNGANDKPNTFVMATDTPTESLDPVVTSLVSTYVWHNLAFDPLVSWGLNENGEWEITEDLAENYEWITDGDEALLQFTLPSDVTFHNGDELTAEHVKEHFDYFMDPDVPAGGNYGTVRQWITQVSVDNNTVVNLHFDEVNVAAMGMLRGVSIVHPGLREEMGAEEFGLNAVGENSPGTGPYRITEWDDGNRITFEKFDDYYQDDLPQFDNAEVRIIPEASARASQLEAGDLHMDMFTSEVNWIEHQDNPDITTGRERAGNFTFLGINHTVEPLGDARVRRAMRAAVDGQAIVDAAFEGIGQPITVPHIPETWAAFPEIDEQLRYDPGLAEDLLEEAGYGDGFDLNLTAATIHPFETIAPILQQFWGDVGISTNIVSTEYSAMWGDVFQGEFEVFIAPSNVGWEMNTTLDLFHLEGQAYKPVSLGWDSENSEYEEFEQAVLDARRVVDRDVRREHYEAALEIYHRQMPTIMLTSADNIGSWRAELANFDLSPAPNQTDRNIQQINWSS
ncbi:ABC transporter substrate-binding protein [Natrialbaceae archaeon A-CW1-1]